MLKGIGYFSLAFALGLLFLTGACQNNEFADEIKQIDSLLAIHQETNAILMQVDTVGAKSSREIFAGKWGDISEAIEEVESEEMVRDGGKWEFITLYSANDRSLRKLLTRHYRLLERHERNGDQLNALRQSIRRSHIPKDSVEHYVMSETMYISETHQEVVHFTPELIKIHRTLDSLHQYADEALQYYRALGPKAKVSEK